MMKIYLLLAAIAITGVVSGAVEGHRNISSGQSDVSKGEARRVSSRNYDFTEGGFNQSISLPSQQHGSSDSYSGLNYTMKSVPALYTLQTDLVPPDVVQSSLDQYSASDSVIHVKTSHDIKSVPYRKRDISNSYFRPYTPAQNTISGADRRHIAEGSFSTYDAINTYSNYAKSPSTPAPHKNPDTTTNQKSSASPSSPPSRHSTPLSPDYDAPNTFFEIPFSSFGQRINLDTRKPELNSLPNAIHTTLFSNPYFRTGNGFDSAPSNLSPAPKRNSKFTSSQSSNYHDYSRELGSVPKTTVDHTSLISPRYTLEVLYGPNEAFHPGLDNSHSREDVFRADRQQSPVNPYPQYDVKFDSSKYTRASDVSSKRNNPSYFLGERPSSTDGSFESSRNNYNFGNSQLEDKFSDPINYKFAYQIQDKASGANFGHEENRNDIGAKGAYRVTLPDGRIQVVHYQAGEEGYVPTIHYEPSHRGTAASRRAQATRKSSFRRTQQDHY